MPRIMNGLGWSIGGALVLALVAALAGVIYAGPLDPSKPPAPTQSNLIFQPANCAGFPITLSAGGAYRLAENITMPASCAKDGIVIASDNVSLDIAGFTIQGIAGAGAGVNVTSGQKNLVLLNGVVKDWPGGGVNFALASQSRLSQLQVTGNGAVAGSGQVTLGDASTLRDCIVTAATGVALGLTVPGSGSVVDGCVFETNGGQGLKVTGSNNRITNNHATDNDRSNSGCADFWIAGQFTVVSDNTAIYSSAFDSCPFYIDVPATATRSSIYRNTALRGTPNYSNNCGGSCDVGPIAAAATATSRWANLSY